MAWPISRRQGDDPAPASDWQSPALVRSSVACGRKVAEAAQDDQQSGIRGRDLYYERHRTQLATQNSCGQWLTHSGSSTFRRWTLSRTWTASMNRESRQPNERVESSSSRRIVPRTANLPRSSRFLYRLEHYSSLPSVALAIVLLLIGLVATGAALGFPSGWVAGFEVGTSAVTLMMVFAIQHTQGREQLATQRKLDELLRALPGAAEELMMLEEAPRETMLDIEEGQRETRSESVDGHTHES